MNRFLADALSARALPHAEALRLREPPQRARIHERVVEHEIGFLKMPDRAQRPEFGVAGPGANQRNAAYHGLAAKSQIPNPKSQVTLHLLS
jgi:hypothetical protein